MSAYYNEFDPFDAEWIRNLCMEGLVSDGTVDDRSICDVQAADVAGFRRCHFFAGVAGWDLAFQLSGIPDDLSVWSGSCPCQPFSSAGKQKGHDDERHLWPEFLRLIRECRPEYLFGEQVGNAVGHGWLDGVFADLEAAGYTCGVCVLGAHSVGAPHIRQRIYWGAKRISDAGPPSARRNSRPGSIATAVCGSEVCGRGQETTEPTGCSRGMGHADGTEFQHEPPAGQQSLDEQDYRPADGLQHAESDGRDARRTESSGRGTASGCERLRHAIDQGLQGHAGDGVVGDESGRIDANEGRSIAAAGAWSDFTIGHFRDGKSRRIGRGVQPLAHGIPAKRSDPRMGYVFSRLEELGYDSKAASRILKQARANRTGRLKGYGNAIVPQLAAMFVRSFVECSEDMH